MHAFRNSLKLANVARLASQAIVLPVIIIALMPVVHGSEPAGEARTGVADLHVTVTDAAGQPLADAAVMLDMPGLASEPVMTAVMDQRDRQFQPYVLLVSPGAKVEFPNSDDIRHHVYSFSPAKRFELKLYSGTSAKPVTFDTPGLVTLGCNIHDWMLGFILVSEAPRRGVTNENGRVQFAQLPAGEAVIKTWHPRFGSSGLIERRVTLPAESGLEIALEVGPELRRKAPDIDEQLDQRRDQRRSERR